MTVLYGFSNPNSLYPIKSELNSEAFSLVVFKGNTLGVNTKPSEPYRGVFQSRLGCSAFGDRLWAGEIDVAAGELGRFTRNVVPPPLTLWTSMLPRCS